MAQREEESLLEDMRATIRADRERAAARSPQAGEPAVAGQAGQPETPEPPGGAAKSMLRRLLRG